MSSRLRQQGAAGPDMGAGAGPNPGAGSAPDDDVVDADYQGSLKTKINLTVNPHRAG